MRHDTEIDTELGQRLRALRERDRACAPAFATLMARGMPRNARPPLRFAWVAGGAALAAAVGAFLLLQTPPQQQDADAVALPSWPTRTAFLLADAGAPSRGLGWTSSPTSGIGQPAFPHLEEKR